MKTFNFDSTRTENKCKLSINKIIEESKIKKMIGTVKINRTFPKEKTVCIKFEVSNNIKTITFQENKIYSSEIFKNEYTRICEDIGLVSYIALQEKIKLPFTWNLWF